MRVSWNKYGLPPRSLGPGQLYNIAWQHRSLRQTLFWVEAQSGRGVEAHLEQERRGFKPRPKCPQKSLLAGRSALGVSGRTVRIPKVFVLPESLEILALRREQAGDENIRACSDLSST